MYVIDPVVKLSMPDLTLPDFSVMQVLRGSGLGFGSERFDPFLKLGVQFQPLYPREVLSTDQFGESSVLLRTKNKIK